MLFGIVLFMLFALFACISVANASDKPENVKKSPLVENDQKMVKSSVNCVSNVQISANLQPAYNLSALNVNRITQDAKVVHTETSFITFYKNSNYITKAEIINIGSDQIPIRTLLISVKDLDNNKVVFRELYVPSNVAGENVQKLKNTYQIGSMQKEAFNKLYDYVSENGFSRDFARKDLYNF